MGSGATEQRGGNALGNTRGGQGGGKHPERNRGCPEGGSAPRECFPSGADRRLSSDVVGVAFLVQGVLTNDESLSIFQMFLIYYASEIGPEIVGVPYGPSLLGMRECHWEKQWSVHIPFCTSLPRGGGRFRAPKRLRTDLLNNFTRKILISPFEEIGSEIFGGPTPPSRIGKALVKGTGLQPFFVRQVSQE